MTGDPSGDFLHVRKEHTHFYSHDGKEGGHYHTTTTPDEIEYEGYFNTASIFYRINDANLSCWVKPKI